MICLVQSSLFTLLFHPHAILNDWYQLEPSQVLQRFHTDATNGLPPSEVARRQVKYQANELVTQALKSIGQILKEQITASTIVILFVAAIVAALLGDYKDTIAILAIVILTVLIGFNQEYQASRAIAALKSMAVPKVRVCREGQWQDISANQLVPGDLVLLEAGNLVPADGRLIESVNLQVQESTFTGEAEPVLKQTVALTTPNLPLPDRHNMVYMGTSVVSGRGRAVVTETGMQTELGHVTQLMQTITQELTPLQKRLDELGQKLVILALLLVGVILLLGLLRGEQMHLMFLTAVSMAVAVVPEGLPAIVAIALAVGAQRMLKQKALIRQLPAVETLGSVTVICADKTGTLTENRMAVTHLAVMGHSVDLTNLHTQLTLSPAQGYSPILVAEPALTLLLMGATLCNDTILVPDPKDSTRYHTLGDPTEEALVKAAAQLGLWKPHLEKIIPRVSEFPFDPERRRMTTVHRIENLLKESALGTEINSLLRSVTANPQSPAYIALTKGGVTSLLEIASQVWVHGQPQPISHDWQQYILDTNNQLAQMGMRVLGVGLKPLESWPTGILQASPWSMTDLEQHLIFVGMLGIRDPARSEAKGAVQTCQSAGIRPLMITGDQALTARTIAQELGIPSDEVQTGQTLAQLSKAELCDRVEQVSVYARVSPQQKLAIIEALQQRGHVVAMTGDGVNDAPALRKADIGVAMGIAGTDVAKEAADMVLLDDNFATIVAAVKEGRVIYDNIRKSIQYLLSSNSAEIWVMLVAPLLGMPLPLLPIQILWINLMTDGLPALALSVEPAEQLTMQRPPYLSTENIFTRNMGWHILWLGLLAAAICLSIGYGYWQHNPAANWQTMLFTTLTLTELWMVLAVRSSQDSLFRVGIYSNPSMVGAIALTLSLQLAVIYIPPLQTIFQTQALSLRDLGLSVLVSSTVFWVVECQKWLSSRQNREKSEAIY